jgi:hypothetical protein
MSPIRNCVSLEGRELGAKLAKWCDDAEPKARLRMPELPPRCASCAYREGSHLANGSPATQMDALKCAMEGIEFYCHDVHREGHLCSGWAMFMLALDKPEDLKQMPWELIGGHDPEPPAPPIDPNWQPLGAVALDVLKSLGKQDAEREG